MLRPTQLVTGLQSLAPKVFEQRGAQGERLPPAMPPPAKKSDVEHPLKLLLCVLGDSPTSPWGRPGVAVPALEGAFQCLR